MEIGFWLEALAGAQPEIHFSVGVRFRFLWVVVAAIDFVHDTIG